MTYQILHGATAQPQTIAQSATFDTLVGVRQSIVQMDWSMQQGNKADGTPNFTSFPVSIADTLWRQGQVYVHSWATYDWINKVAWSTADVLAGKYDQFLHAQAALIRKWAHPFFIRLNHEFNGQWAPWFRPASEFVALWHYMVTLFRQDGATNITWLWCPSELDPVGSSTTFAADKIAAYLPDLSEVDWVACDSYNRGASKPSADWRWFARTADLSYGTIAALAPTKPMMWAEFGSVGTPADKASWIVDALSVIPVKYPKMAAICYYQHTDGTWAWPLLAADGTAAAWTAGLATGPYAQPGFVMPPDLKPIVPLQSVAAWGDPVGPLVVQLGQSQAQVSDLTAQVTVAQADAITAHAALDVLSTSLAQAQSDRDAAQSQTNALVAQVTSYQDAAGQITTGLDALRSLTIQL